MELRYYINTTQIAEPIGFDDFKTILKRTEQHGVSAESSVGSLEFDGVGFGMIKTAYDTDIDSELIFKCEIKCNDLSDWEEDYKGVIDLSTFEENKEDYCSCKVKIGEIGVKTTFNNRVDTAVDIARLTSLDGDVLSAYGNIGKSITIPAKGLLFSSRIFTLNENNTSYIGYPFASTLYLYPNYDINISELGIIEYLENTHIDEFGSDSNQFQNTELNTPIKVLYNINTNITNNDSSAINVRVAIKVGNDNPIYDPYIAVINPSQSLDVIFNGTHTENTNRNIRVYLSIYNPTGDYSTPSSIYYNIVFKHNLDSFIKYEYLDTVNSTTSKVSLIHETLSRLTEIYSGLTVKSNYYGRLDSEINPSIALGGGALKSIISGLQLRNAYLTDGSSPKVETSFKDMFLNLNAIDNVGWGFSKELKILETFTTIELVTAANPLQTDITFTTDISNILKVGDILEMLGSDLIGFTATIVSFPDNYTARFSGDISEFYADGIIATLKVFDIGYIDYIRVENWKWFYNNNVLMTIDNPAKKKRSMRDNVFTRLKVGYEKYGGQDDINSIDTFHTNREFTSGIKAIDKLNTQVSKLIADPYAIEFTRRKALDKTTKDWKYDESLFVLALQKTSLISFLADYSGLYFTHRIPKNVFDILQIGDTIVYNSTNYVIDSKINFILGIETTPNLPTSDVICTFDYSLNSLYTVEQGVLNSDDTIISPETMTNSRISPKRNAMRWADRLFELNSPITEMKFTAGTGNVTAKGNPTVTAGYDYLEDAGSTATITENSDLDKVTPYLSAQLIEFEYPLTRSEYETIKADPYGIITVDGEDCYIDEIIREPMTSLCNFKLIPKI